MSAKRETFIVTLEEGGVETEYEAKTIWADTIAAEKFLRDNGHGALVDNQIQALTVMVYSALKRTGAIPASTVYSTFEGLIVTVLPKDEVEQPKS